MPNPIMTTHPWKRGALGLVLGAVLNLSACGGGGASTDAQASDLRAVPAALIQQPAVAYSPFRSANRDSEVITKAMIRQDLLLLRGIGIGLIRLYDSSDEVAKQTLEVIAEDSLPIKVMLGMYLNPNAESANQAEIARGIALAKAFPQTVAAVSVGNETMVSWSFVPQTSAVMATYLSQVRAAVAQPVTTNDNWAFFASEQNVNPPEAVLATIDFVAMHSYPLLDTVYNPNLWDWRQTSIPAPQRAAAMMDAALSRIQFEYRAVRENLNQKGYANLPVVIGEAGWKAEPSGGEVQRASPINQKMYFDRLEAWKRSGSGPATIVHFQAFDEPWKGGDDKWGLFNVRREARCVARIMNPALTSLEPGSCDVADAVYHVPPVGGSTITANRYTVYAEAGNDGEARVAALVLNAWENGSTAGAAEVTEMSGDGVRAWQISPTPQVWGWGMTWAESGTEVDLSNFQASTARLNFRIKTTYPGPIEVGFLTGSALDGSAWDVYRAISPGQYGYNNDGQWRSVSIPVSDLVSRGAMAFGMTNPAVSRLQMNRVSNLLVIADRFGVTGNPAGAKPLVLVDDVHWTR